MNAKVNKPKRNTIKTHRTDRSYGPQKPLKRSNYFRYYRTERNMLSTMENCYPQSFDRKTYRDIRYLYHVIIPHLSRFLWLESDRTRLINVASYLHEQVLSYLFVKGFRGRPPGRKDDFLFRPTPWNTVKQQSSVEPILL